MTAPVVTQADRDAAQALCASGWTHAIEAFARHRTAAEAASAATVAELVDALEELVDLQVQCEKQLTEELYHMDFCGESTPLTNARAILARAKATEQGEG
jgi:predicted ATPase with chaperone activity